ncbi:hypothetical protein CC1G_00515 [Coprinopsis cinerea okayama7|uniref:RRM domain-containing protein n=1 Tax=Coprinopsis cinerea (strain Okayama-7 / 130 / ATCC MYA-4618 / FGSC 9003) TaxID=240176 RepID=A8N391_COPC7|nr:hypothetical protein CC1G_00515 [Coprinopsis cinerea okayama7\|eukprot:XP_001829336.1 hypothetical protein CC1G_00515 [Coprinopsis cinerea okayama7\
MAAALSGLSASVTRILYLTGFPKELKTKDIQSTFSDYENLNGGFKIKWRDDTSLLIVFNDPSIAKRAYLHTIAYPPPILNGASIRPYDGPDAQSVIQAVNARSQHHSNASRSHNARAASISVIPGGRANQSGSSNHRHTNHGNGPASHVSIPEHPGTSAATTGGREPSPTLPNLPSHPTLNALISSSLGEAALVHSDPAILAASLQSSVSASSGESNTSAIGPRIGDPGKRMLGAALGVRHPGLGGRVNGSNNTSSNASPAGQSGVDLPRAMSALIVADS